MNELLRVENLKTYFFIDKYIYKAVDGITFSIENGKSIGLVGESGSGKSMTALSILRLIPDPPAKIVGGKIYFKGKDLISMPEKKFQKGIRGKDISIIFQEPHASLNPVLKIKTQLVEHYVYHLKKSYKKAIELAKEMLSLVGINNPLQALEKYPHQFSGGQIQRIMIAMALITNPSLVIADEPTTALDVTIQRQILDLMVSLKEKKNISYLLITHNLAIVSYLVDYIYIIYAGEIIESGTVEEIFSNPLHPYTKGLLDSILTIDRDYTKPIRGIEGSIPQAHSYPAGCRFHPRCKYAKDRCKNPPSFVGDKNHRVKCWLYER